MERGKFCRFCDYGSKCPARRRERYYKTNWCGFAAVDRKKVIVGEDAATPVGEPRRVLPLEYFFLLKESGWKKRTKEFPLTEELGKND